MSFFVLQMFWFPIIPVFILTIWYRKSPFCSLSRILQNIKITEAYTSELISCRVLLQKLMSSLEIMWRMPKEPWSHTGRFTKGKQPGRVRKMTERSAAVLQTLCSTEKRIPGAYPVRMRHSRQRKSFWCMPVIFRREMTPKHFLDLQRTWIFRNTMLPCLCAVVETILQKNRS